MRQGLSSNKTNNEPHYIFVLCQREMIPIRITQIIIYKCTMTLSRISRDSLEWTEKEHADLTAR